ncbi:RHS repeat-associated core domain-containing protein [Phenylobacterium sp.]|jgi:RHS repeat-associated protein|uniref:RHS repeat-associated core domain-containing protein n=1 Tax=Phenylobacterium sp. TaxID=1871053 RepID=UPI002E2FC8B0|nr:RHS repeat-associated core domain-containing protein [Phenylobacterium sp.]HEX3365615.1 RHS repeat-associated core domain-containing protein [Phenylobacterium sp.]
MASGGAALRGLLRLGLGVLASLAIWQSAEAAASTKIGTAPLLTPSAADAYYGSATTHTNSTSVSARPAEVQELARALKNDPDLIYEYVRNNTEIVWTYGLTKGAMGVIVDRAGTSFDQAHLMMELLRQSGFTASYNLGTITLTGAQFQAWSGITSATAACQLLSSGGIPAAINGSTSSTCSYGAATITTIDVSHAWVSVVIQGVTYVYDPAYKDHTFTTGLNLGTATGMTSGTMIGLGATSGTTSGIGYVQAIPNTTLSGVTADLNTYAAALDTALSTSLPTAGVADIVGGQAINTQAIPPGGLRQLSLPYTTNVLRTITGDLPDQYRTSLRVQVSKARPGGSSSGVIDQTLYVDEIYGWRLIFDPNFDTTGATFNATLKLVDDFGTVNSLATTGSFSDNPTYSRGDVTLTANLPYAANSGAYMDAVVTRTLTYALPFTIVHGWGDEGRGLVDKWGARRDGAMPAPPDSTCHVCFNSYKSWKGDGRRELLAAEWLAQASRAARLNAAIGKSIFAQHYSIGFSSADTTVVHTSNGSYWITDSFDRLDVETGMSLTSTSATALDRRAAVFSTVGALSALKGNVTAQVADLVDASSSANRFEWGNAPDTTTDPAGGYTRPVYLFQTTTDASFAMALATSEYMTTTTNTDYHSDSATPPIGATEVVARRQALSDAVNAYVTAGFSVAASSEAFLGPGSRAGGFAPYSSGQYTHSQSPQRGGALVATKYDVNGDPTEIAHIAVNPTGLVDGGGGGAQMFQQMEYDPATAADVVKGRFVSPQVGSATVASAASMTIGSGGFPFSLTGKLTWRDGDVREETYGPGAHREPQGGWTTPYNNTLTVSGSGLEAMGDTDARATIGTVAAFWAAQDLYRASPSLKRDVVGELIMAWWGHTMTQNVATVAVGTNTQQFVRKPNGTWFSPGPGTYYRLAQTGAPTISPRHPNGYTTCQTNMLSYVPTRGWSYSGVSFAVTGPKGDVEAFDNWTNQMVDTPTVTCAEQRGLRISSWAAADGAQLNYTYSRPSGYSTQIEVLDHIMNNLGGRLNFTNGGFGGFFNAVVGSGLRQLTTSTVGGQTSHTDPIGSVTKFDISTLGTGDYAKLRMQNVYAADDGTNPSRQYLRDTLGRVEQIRDKLVLQGARAPRQLYLANGLRTEAVNALGYSSITYADLNGRAIRTINPLGAVSTTVYDGRGRPGTVTSPDSIQTQFQYNDRNLLTQKTINANPASAEAGQTIVTQFGWDTTNSLMVWSKDAKGAETGYTYSYGDLTNTQYPPASTGATRLTSANYFYPTGQALGMTVPLGQEISATYTGASVYDLNNTVGSLSDDMIAVTLDYQGDATQMRGMGYDTIDITRDNLRRVTLYVEPLPNSSVPTTPRVATRVTYDVLGRTTKAEKGSYIGTTFTPIETYSRTYDAVGNLATSVTPAGLAQYSYDALNRVVCTAVRMNADAYGSLPADACAPSTVGPMGPDRISRATYDPAGHVVQTETGVGSPLQQVTARFGYSPSGLKTSLTDANGNRSTFEYDGFNRFKRLRYPAPPRGSGTSSTTDYEENTYDVNGNVTVLRRRDGTTIAYSYDALNRVTLKDLPGTTTGDVYYSYTVGGFANGTNLVIRASFGSSTNTTSYTKQFDQAGRLVLDGANIGGSFFYSNTLSYDGAGHLLNAIYAAFTSTRDCCINNTISYGYDGASRLIGVRIGLRCLSPACTTEPVETITYGALNRRASVTRPNGVTTTYGYDGAGRLTSLGHAGPTPSLDFLQTLSYGPSGQLLSQGQASNPYIWSGQPTTTANFTHDQLNRDAAMAAASGYDANGNLISDGVRSFTYDAENRLTGVTGGTVPVTLAYDPWGRLSTVTASGATTIFANSGDQVLGELQQDPSGSGASASLRDYIYGPGGELLSWHAGADFNTALSWFHTDRIGSVVATSDPVGAITAYTYGPYGEPQSWAGSRFRYTGQMAIPEAQLYHYRARAYDPMMGRFLQTDPIRYGDGANIYAYVHGDPVNGSDPSGLTYCDNPFFDDTCGPDINIVPFDTPPELLPPTPEPDDPPGVPDETPPQPIADPGPNPDGAPPTDPQPIGAPVAPWQQALIAACQFLGICDSPPNNPFSPTPEDKPVPEQPVPRGTPAAGSGSPGPGGPGPFIPPKPLPELPFFPFDFVVPFVNFDPLLWFRVPIPGTRPNPDA